METAPASIEVFYSFAEEDAPLLEQLERHLSLLRHERLISTWHKRQIRAGSDWRTEVDHHLDTASLILLLISSDFLASDYCYGTEMQRALQRQKANEAIVIPLLLRSCDWQSAPFATLQALPTGNKPIATWRDRDAAWTDVVKGIRRALGGRPMAEGHPISRAGGGERNIRNRKHTLRQHLRPIGCIAGFAIVVFVLIVALFRTILPMAAGTPSPTPTIGSPDPLQQATKGAPTLNDPLTVPKNWTNHDASEGDVGDCTFSDGGYLATAPSPGFKVTCPSQSTTFSDFAFQVDMKILQGDCGGIFFRAIPTSGTFYYFHVCRNGTYTFFRYDKLYVQPQQLVSPTSSTAINKGDKTNSIAVVTQEDRLYLYVNGQQVAHVNDPLYSNGQIGVVAADGAGASEPTKVVFSNAKVWVP